jgi:hypothetical protein
MRAGSDATKDAVAGIAQGVDKSMDVRGATLQSLSYNPNRFGLTGPTHGS